METYPDVKIRHGMDFLLCHMNLDISKAEKILGYAPTKTAQEGLIAALRWCEESGRL